MRTIRRSGARDLPPAADSVQSAVIIEASRPRPDDIIQIMSPAGILLKARVTEITVDNEGWVGWAIPSPDTDRQLKDAGVPACGPNEPMRIFSWQLLKNLNSLASSV